MSANPNSLDHKPAHNGNAPSIQEVAIEPQVPKLEDNFANDAAAAAGGVAIGEEYHTAGDSKVRIA